MTIKEAKAGQGENSGDKLGEMREFSRLVEDYWKRRIDREEGADGIKQRIESILSGKGGKKEQDGFLWETIRQKIIDGSMATIGLLDTQRAKDFYLVDEREISVEEYKRRVLADPEKYMEIYPIIHEAKRFFSNVTLDHPDSDYSFPYDNLDKASNPYLANVSANLGHDIFNIPGFYYLVYQLPGSLLPEESTESWGLHNNAYRRIILNQLPLLHPGLVWLFESFKQMAENSYPQKNGADFSKIVGVVASEAIVRAFRRDLSIFNCNGSHYEIDSDEESKKIRTRQTSFSVQSKIEPGLELAGNEAGLHLLLYQLVKNSVALLQLPVHYIKEAEVSLTAKKCEINGVEMIAFRICDNGPGIDFAVILRAKQKILQENRRELTAKEQAVAGDWTCLGLRIREVVDFIFERRVSGAESGELHSGIGLALAKQIVDQHRGCIWATNLSGKKGAKFLVLLDPSSEGGLKRGLPELFDIDQVPAQILDQIDHQLDEYQKE